MQQSGPIFNRFWEIDWVRFLSKIGLDSFSGREGAGGGGGHSKAPISLEECVGKRYKVKGIFFNEIKGGTERTGVQRFLTRYVEINAVKDNFNFFYWMPFSNIKMVNLILSHHGEARFRTI